jgi:hypothetical protein
MGGRSSSSSASNTTSNTEDSRVAGDGNAIGISADGNVSLIQTSEEAWELGAGIVEVARALATQSLDLTEKTSGLAINQIGTTLERVLESQKSEEGQLSGQLIRLGIPAAALAYIVSRVIK